MKATLLLSFICLHLTALTLAGPRKPVIIGQQPLSTSEDAPLTIQLDDLTVIDADDWYPYGFTLTLRPGDNYTVDAQTISPAKDFYGTLVVKVTVNDGKNESNAYDLKITVNSVNDPPVITGQNALSTIEAVAITLKLADLSVTDPDNSYPTGFSLTIQPGTNYTISGTTVTTKAGITGDVMIPITVSDGQASSAVFNLKINVIPANKKPIITGQKPLTSAKNKSFTLDLSYLLVDDPDSSFPSEFKIIISNGSGYTVSGQTITPSANFVGTLTIPVAVNDGHSTSDIFNFKAEVKDELAIIGQNDLSVNEDEKLSITLSDVKVYDPQNKFPNGYSLKIDAGEHYTANGLEITPEKNFNGPLAVAVRVTNGTITSAAYNLRINVAPINDAPELVNFPEQPLRYMYGAGSKALYSGVTINDPDDTSIILLEIGFDEGYQISNDVLRYSEVGNIKGVFDAERGVLSLLGQANIAEYQQVLQSIAYEYLNIESPEIEDKSIYARLSDGKTVSALYQRKVVAGEDYEFDIPTAFSPNNDHANDTWAIKPFGQSERYNSAITRVLNERGVIVFETRGFRDEWDGTYGGQPVPEGTYIYSLDLNLSYETKKLSGTVTIFR